MVSKKITNQISTAGYPAVDLKVTVNRKYVYNEPTDRNIEVYIRLDGLTDSDTLNFISAKCEIVYPNENFKEGLPDELKPLIANKGGQMLFEEARKKGFILFIKELFMHHDLNNCEAEIRELISKVIIKEIKSIEYKSEYDMDVYTSLEIIKANNKPITEERLYKMGYVVINGTEFFVATDFHICNTLTKIAVEIEALKTSNNNILVYREKTDTEEEGFKETSIHDFVMELYVSGLGQLHILNAVFNNKN